MFRHIVTQMFTHMITHIFTHMFTYMITLMFTYIYTHMCTHVYTCVVFQGVQCFHIFFKVFNVFHGLQGLSLNSVVHWQIDLYYI
jgi:hypothetical protein